MSDIEHPCQASYLAGRQHYRANPPPDGVTDESVVAERFRAAKEASRLSEDPDAFLDGWADERDRS